MKSELSKFNNSLDRSLVPSGDFRKVCRLALKFYKETEGFFDPRILTNLCNIGYSKDFSKIDLIERNVFCDDRFFLKDLDRDLIIKDKNICFKERMDLNGIVKGFVIELVSQKLSQSWKNFLVDAGGDIFAAGRNDRSEDWKIELEGFPIDKLCFNLSNEAIATTGISRRKWEIGDKRFHHLINPKNSNNFSFDLRSVSVIANSIIEADVWAKTLFLLGRKKGMDLSEKKGIKSVFLEYNGNIFHSSLVSLNFYKNKC